MEIKDLIKIQKKFDEKHSGRFNWSTRVDESHLEMLEFLMLGLMGEVGELANLIKKIIRGDFELEAKKKEIEEEIVDIFIYLIKLCYQMDFDLEKGYSDKLKINVKKFEKFKKWNIQIIYSFKRKKMHDIDLILNTIKGKFENLKKKSKKLSIKL